MGNLFIALAENVFMVEPGGLLIVKARTRLGTLADVERLYQFVEAEKFLFRAWIPAEHGQEVDHCLGEIATLAVS